MRTVGASRLVLALAVAAPGSGLLATESRKPCPDPGAESRRQLLGTWVQDQTGPVLTYRRLYRFNADSSFELVVTSRRTGSLAEEVLARDRGRFSIREGCLALLPASGAPTVSPWRVERDPYVGDTQLVLIPPDGTRDVYYRE